MVRWADLSGKWCNCATFHHLIITLLPTTNLHFSDCQRNVHRVYCTHLNIHIYSSLRLQFGSGNIYTSQQPQKFKSNSNPQRWALELSYVMIAVLIATRSLDYEGFLSYRENKMTYSYSVSTGMAYRYAAPTVPLYRRPDQTLDEQETETRHEQRVYS